MKKNIFPAILAGTLFLNGCSIADLTGELWKENTLYGGTEQVEAPEPVKKVESISGGNYAYECLDETEKASYDEILDCLLQQEEKVTVETDSAEMLEKVYGAVMADYGEIFWSSGYVYTLYTQGDAVVGMEFAPKYTKSRQERDQLQLEIDQTVDEILQGVDGSASDYEKTKYVFEYLVSNVDYCLGSPENQNIISVFLNRSTVCQGYACATQYLLKKLGIKSTVINGEANGEAHAWNLICLDGAYYYLDTTWGNSAYLNGDEEHSGYVNYNYFAVTTEELSRTHTPSVPFPLPDCVSTADNYYVREGLLIYEWDPDDIGNYLTESYSGSREAVSFKFTTEELCHNMKTYLIDEQHIADYCAGIDSVYYVEDEEQKVLTIYF